MIDFKNIFYLFTINNISTVFGCKNLISKTKPVENY